MSGQIFVFLVSALAFINGEICWDSVCEYEWDIRNARTMTYQVTPSKTYNVGLNGSKLVTVASSYRPAPDPYIGIEVDPSDVITADGYVCDIISINGQFPGPTIEVGEGSQVVVQVVNNMYSMGITVHWHGIYQQGSPWMDGTAFVTQYPILPRQSFTYRFKAYPSGTHWYHSHFASQLGDGLFGLLIVHKILPTIPYHSLIVNDWLHDNAYKIDMDNPSGSALSEKRGVGDHYLCPFCRVTSVDGIELTSVVYSSGLINGKGRVSGEAMPLSSFEVESGLEYRFRMLNSGVEYTYEISIDNHMLNIVALDGVDIQTVTVDSVIISPGQRMDMIVLADQPTDVYWIRAQTLNEGFLNPGEEFDDTDQTVFAILVYDGVDINDPVTSRKSCTLSDRCTVFNCPFAGVNVDAYSDCLDIAGCHTASGYDEDHGLNDEEYTEYFLNTGFNWGSSIKARKMVPPKAPLYDESNPESIVSCDTAGCDVAGQGCVCTHILDIPYGQTVQMVLTNYHSSGDGILYDLATHPMHMHGHSFAVLAMGYPEFNSSTGKWSVPNSDILCDTGLCKYPIWSNSMPAMNLVDPAIVDTVVVPAWGYVVLRFKATNPGPWLFHCHVQTHLFEGMSMIIREAKEVTVPPPEGFPTDLSFTWSSGEFENSLKLAESYISGDVEQMSTPDYGNNGICPQPEGINMNIEAFFGYIIGALVIGFAVACLLALCCTCNKNKSPDSYEMQNSRK